MILKNGRITTLDRSKPNATAVAIADGRFAAVGDDKEVMKLATPKTQVIDLGGRRVIPGLFDSHTHPIRGGLYYNLELRWDGVPSLADAMMMLREQVKRTPAPQWVRVVGGFTEYQFAEKRMPTLEELNAAAPETPVHPNFNEKQPKMRLIGPASYAIDGTNDTAWASDLGPGRRRGRVAADAPPAVETRAGAVRERWYGDGEAVVRRGGRDAAQGGGRHHADLLARDPRGLAIRRVQP